MLCCFRYFTDPDSGTFNCFDFFIVAAGYILTWTIGGSAISMLRMLRLVRLLTFVKGVKTLRVEPRTKKSCSYQQGLGRSFGDDIDAFFVDPFFFGLKRQLQPAHVLAVLVRLGRRLRR